MIKKNRQERSRKALRRTAEELRKRSLSDFSGRVSNYISNISNNLLGYIPAQYRWLIPFIGQELDISAPSIEDVKEKFIQQPGEKTADSDEAILQEHPLTVESPGRAFQEIVSVRGRKYEKKVSSVKKLGQWFIYEGIDVLDRQPVTIKEYLLPQDHGDNLQEFTAIKLADGRIQDLRLITPWDIFHYSKEKKYGYIVFKNNLYSSPTLLEHIAKNGSMNYIEVYRFLNQVLQSLQFLHTQKFRLNGSGDSLLYHGNLNLESLRINYPNHQDFFIYLCDLAFWENQFIPANSQTIEDPLKKDLQDLGEISFHLLGGHKTVKEDASIEYNWPSTVDSHLKIFIEQLIYSQFDNAEIARQNLPEYPALLANGSLSSKLDKKVEKESKTPEKKSNLLFWILGMIGLGLIGGAIWFFIFSQRSEKIANRELQSIDKVSGIPQGKFIYTAQPEPDGVWRYIFTHPKLLPGGISLEGKLQQLIPQLNLKYEKLFQSNLLSVLTNTQVDFAITSVNHRSPDFGYQEFAYDSLAVFVAFTKPGRANSLPPALNGEITLAQLQKIYSGKVTNWEEIGGPNLPIKLYIPNDNESINIFEERVLKTPEAIHDFRNLIKSAVITRQRTFDILESVIKDFEKDTPSKENIHSIGSIGSIGFGSLSKVFGQCSVYPLALVDGNHHPVSPLIQKNGQVLTPQTDLCNEKGNYILNTNAFISQSYPLTYPLAVVYIRDNRREPIGEEFAEILKTSTVQCWLQDTSLVPLQPLGNSCENLSAGEREEFTKP